MLTVDRAGFGSRWAGSGPVWAGLGQPGHVSQGGGAHVARLGFHRALSTRDGFTVDARLWAYGPKTRATVDRVHPLLSPSLAHVDQVHPTRCGFPSSSLVFTGSCLSAACLPGGAPAGAKAACSR
jgi:hypothetical protein